MEGWRPGRIAEPTLEALRRGRADVERMMVSVLDAILERYERDPDYGFIDTKINLITGEDVAPGPDPERDFRGKHVIYSWIQGRGLEAMAGHAEWLPSCSILRPAQRSARVRRIRRLLRGVMELMEAIRARNGGRLFFMLSPEGVPLIIDGEGRLRPAERIPEASNHSELFYSKGLFAAATVLGDARRTEEATRLFRRVLDDIAAGRHTTTQQAFDPKNPVRPVPGRHSHGPRMIALGGLALFHAKTGAHEWLDRAEGFLRHILDRHVNRGRFPEFAELDYFEFLDDAGRPWRTPEGEAPCDPGHALELMGFAAKLAPMFRRAGTPAQAALADECADLLPRLFDHVFALGFNREQGGIVKSFGLVRRRPLNDDMPWWNLPEAVRAAMGLYRLCADEPRRARILAALGDCLNAFLHRFVNPKARLMAYQTRNARGEPVDVIPATPDADPGYHTGLSLIDYLDWLG